MARSDVSAAANASVAQIVEYAPDRRGWSVFAALAGAHRRDLNGARAVVPTHGEDHGYKQSPQRLTGLAPLALGSGRPVAERNGDIGDERSSELDNPALRIFAERMRRQQDSL